MTTLGSVAIVSPDQTDSKMQHFFIGTSQGFLLKLVAWASRIENDYITKLEEPLIHQQNISLNIADATFYLLSKHKLIQLPMTSCSVYSTCSECFKSKSIRSSSDWCHWHENHCYLKSELPIQIAKEQPKCSPIVLDFEPKSGPVEGGTQIKFYGKNFGDSHQMIENHNSFLNITVGIFRCSVLEKKNDFVRCQIESDKQSVLDYMHSNPDGKI